jgi:ATP-dependent Clp protease adaptor protein ClpS
MFQNQLMPPRSPRLETRPEEAVRQLAKLLPPYKVILFNDDYNEMDYVVAALLRVVNHLARSEAFEIMMTAHLQGNAIVVVCPKELAEHYQERLLSYGLTATIEPE